MTAEARPTSDIDRAYHALHHGAVLADRSDRLRMRFTGDKAAISLTGLVTNDVASLSAGQGQYAAALTPKGKVLADLRIFARAGDFLVDTNPAAGPGFFAMIRKFVNPRLAKYEDASQQTFDLGLFGRGAQDMLRSTFPDANLAGLPVYAHIAATFGDESVMIARVPDFGVEGYDVIGPRTLMETLRSKLAAAGAVESGADVLAIARIEAGRPEWGADMDDSMLAQEVDMDRLDAISFTKGCYTGQETVARVHYRGHVNRLLRGVRFSEGTVPPHGTELHDSDGKSVATVKSAAVSPRLGAIALALVRREVEPGAVLRADVEGHTVEKTVE